MSITSNDTTVNDRLKELAAALSREHARKSEAEERIAAIKDEMRVLAGPAFVEGEKFTTAEGVTVACIRRTGRRFDMIKAAQVIPDSVVPLVSTMQIDPKVVKVKLGQKAYDACLSEGTLTVVVK